MSQLQIGKVDSPLIIQPTMNFFEHSERGFGNSDVDSLAIPFLKLLQSVGQDHANIPGIRPGVFFNANTLEMLESVNVIHCNFRRKFLQWGFNSQFKGEHDPAEVIGMDTHIWDDGKLRIGKEPVLQTIDKTLEDVSDQLKDTRMHYVLVQSKDGSWSPAIFAMQSTQIKISKNWLTRMKMIRFKSENGESRKPVTYAHIFKFSSIPQEKITPKGKFNWFIPAFTLEGVVSDKEVFEMAKEFSMSVDSGQIVESKIEEFA